MLELSDEFLKKNILQQNFHAKYKEIKSIRKNYKLIFKHEYHWKKGERGMVQNIAIIGLDRDVAYEVSKMVANQLEMHFLDTIDLFEFDIN